MPEPSPADALPAVGKRRVALLVLLGLALREAFSFWTGHPYDFEVWIRTAYVVAHGSNPYVSFWPAAPGVSIDLTTQTLPSAAYPPFWALLLGGLFRIWEAVGGGDRFALYFLLKQPAIAGDLAVGLLLYRIVGRWTADATAARRALGFWMVFPYAIVVGAIWGQFDSILVAILLGLLLARSDVERVALDGLGIFVKWLTVIFLPLELFRARGARRLIPLLGVAIPVALTLISFAAMGWSLVGIQATASGESEGGGGGMNLAQFLSAPTAAPYVEGVPHLMTVLFLLWVPVVIVGGALAARWLPGDGRAAPLRAFLFVTALFLLVRWGLNEQYMLYLFGLLAVDLFAFHPGRWRLFLATVAASFGYLLTNNNLGIWYLAPLNSGYWTNTSHADVAGPWGPLRADLLLVFSAVVTLLLIRWVVAIYADDPAPRLWPPVRWSRREPAVAPTPVP